jgi:hypothetical protein
MNKGFGGYRVPFVGGGISSLNAKSKDLKVFDSSYAIANLNRVNNIATLK